MRARFITPQSSRPVFQVLVAFGIAPALRRGALALLLAVLAIACSQGDGEPCQEDRDCEDGLICLPARGAERSVCGTADEVELDAGGDGGGDPDLPPDDAGRGDAGPDDGGDEPSDLDAGDEPSDVDAG
jgi:hypothetical protein